MRRDAYGNYDRTDLQDAAAYGLIERLPRRWLNRIVARLFGFFWLDCPGCGQMFGGHECFAGEAVGNPFGTSRGSALCPACTHYVREGAGR